MSIRVGKLGIVRLTGEDIRTLREQVALRDKNTCVVCRRWISWMDGHMAHIVSRGRGGSDTLENCVWKCPACHLVKEHAGGKPCPKK